MEVATKIHKHNVKVFMELHHELVAYEPQAHQALLARAQRILNACDMGEMLPRGLADPSRFECKYCDWSERCWAWITSPD